MLVTKVLVWSSLLEATVDFRKLSSELTFVKVVDTFKVLNYIRKVHGFVFPLVW